ncbi:hypothetical protein [Altibacter sp. HG106]|uniref:hypothetical protein n=1 Tax=Altibacter sp. HG106 TaxID=3023937 RepID=UPI0023501F92|nr:hypothetical protein [Altibacter sp. HG106]MDC7995961.1 hypothetical protein [Altibacter sp. HG106]
MKRLFSFYLQSSIHVALAVTALAYITYTEYAWTPSSELLLFVFFGTITAYNFVKYAGIAGLHHRSLARSLRTIQLFSLICFCILVYVGLQLSREVWLAVLIFGGLTLLYAVPFARNKSLRTLSGTKIFIVAITWAGVTVLVPAVATKAVLLEPSLMLTAVQRFLLVLVWTLPFEIRDLRFDDPRLGTFPQRLGIDATKYVGTAITGVVFLLEYFKEPTNYEHAYSVLFIVGISAAALLLTPERPSRNYAAFWVEGIPIIWMMALLLLTHYLPIF